MAKGNTAGARYLFNEKEKLCKVHTCFVIPSFQKEKHGHSDINAPTFVSKRFLSLMPNAYRLSHGTVIQRQAYSMTPGKASRRSRKYEGRKNRGKIYRYERGDKRGRQKYKNINKDSIFKNYILPDNLEGFAEENNIEYFSIAA